VGNFACWRGNSGIGCLQYWWQGFGNGTIAHKSDASPSNSFPNLAPLFQAGRLRNMVVQWLLGFPKILRFPRYGPTFRAALLRAAVSSTYAGDGLLGAGQPH
jgi:hypothetical protein